MKRIAITPTFKRNFWLALPLLLEIATALLIADTPYAHYVMYFPFIIVVTFLVVLILGTILALIDAWKGNP